MWLWVRFKLLFQRDLIYSCKIDRHAIAPPREQLSRLLQNKLNRSSWFIDKRLKELSDLRYSEWSKLEITIVRLKPKANIRVELVSGRVIKFNIIHDLF